MRRWIVFMIFAATVFLSTSCKPTPEEGEKSLFIGIAFDTFVVERWQRDLEILVATLTELGAHVEVQIANENQQKQVDQIKYLIGQKVDVLIVVPNDAYGLVEVVDEAKREGIKVLSYDRLILNANVDGYISFDNFDIGSGMTERLIRHLGEEKSDEPFQLLMINGGPKDYNATLIKAGSLEVLQPYIEAEVYEVAEEVWAFEWREQYAKELVENHMRSGKPLHGIIAANDVLATGAIEVLAKWQAVGAVAVVSQDAELSACQRIVEGSQLATVYKPISDIAVTAAHAAIRLAQGKGMGTEETISNGLKEVPYLKLDAVVIDALNLEDQIIDSGFHRREDVFLNVTP